MGVIIDPIPSPYILEYGSAVFLNYGSVLAQKYAYAIKQIVINIPHDRCGSVVGIWPLASFPVTAIKGYSL